ncbi:MAG: hypothetical protein ACR2PL_13420, partial [Dehalococcoidia bacterium]
PPSTAPPTTAPGPVPSPPHWSGEQLPPVLFGLFMVLAATGTTRGPEARGELDIVLCMLRSRYRWFAETASGLLLALLAAAVPLWLAVLATGKLAKGAPLHPGRGALAVLTIVVAAGFSAHSHWSWRNMLAHDELPRLPRERC